MAIELRAPTIADFVRTHRKRPRPGHPSGYSRQKLATLVPASLSYLSQIESGERTSPKPEFIDALSTALQLSSVEKQHLHNLALPKSSGPRTHAPLTVAKMRTLITPDMESVMDGLAPHLSGYVDERWFVLAANEVYDQAYPRLLEVGNVLTWFFAVPESRSVMLEWEAEARLTVNWFRWHMGRYGNSDWALELLSQLSTSREFTAMWLEERVDFQRHQPLMHLRDPDTDKPYSVRVQIADVPGATVPFQWFIGIKTPFNGPENLLKAP
ncbi:helix-turn-helix domain-containing protein [Nocardia sp. 004]|uniref:helix-turn-helix domain-containing protein n=1 Tax=Nocardia sp. 004 TaxID=3385978 RepID=UPI0039A26ED1